MTTVTVEVPDGLFAKITNIPTKERAAFIERELTSGEYAPAVHANLLEAIQEELFAQWVESQQMSPEEDRADMIAVVNAALEDIENGGRTYSINELMDKWGITQEDLDNTPDGIVNGQIK